MAASSSSQSGPGAALLSLGDELPQVGFIELQVDDKSCNLVNCLTQESKPLDMASAPYSINFDSDGSVWLASASGSAWIKDIMDSFVFTGSGIFVVVVDKSLSIKNGVDPIRVAC